jgi:hypothetical protein
MQLTSVKRSPYPLCRREAESWRRCRGRKKSTQYGEAKIYNKSRTSLGFIVELL